MIALVQEIVPFPLGYTTRRAIPRMTRARETCPTARGRARGRDCLAGCTDPRKQVCPGRCSTERSMPPSYLGITCISNIYCRVMRIVVMCQIVPVQEVLIVKDSLFGMVSCFYFILYIKMNVCASLFNFYEWLKNWTSFYHIWHKSIKLFTKIYKLSSNSSNNI